jgi:hypothetical protein
MAIQKKVCSSPITFRTVKLTMIKARKRSFGQMVSPGEGEGLPISSCVQAGTAEQEVWILGEE